MSQHVQGSASATAGKKAQWQRHTDWRASLGVCQAVEPCGRSFAAPTLSFSGSTARRQRMCSTLDVGHQQGSKVGGPVHAGHAVNINGAACGQRIKDTGANVVPSLPTAGRVGQSDVVVARSRVHVGTLFLKGLSKAKAKAMPKPAAAKKPPLIPLPPPGPPPQHIARASQETDEEFFDRLGLQRWQRPGHGNKPEPPTVVARWPASGRKPVVLLGGLPQPEYADLFRKHSVQMVISAPKAGPQL